MSKKYPVKFDLYFSEEDDFKAKDDIENIEKKVCKFFEELDILVDYDVVDYNPVWKDCLNVGLEINTSLKEFIKIITEESGNERG